MKRIFTYLLAPALLLSSTAVRAQGFSAQRPQPIADSTDRCEAPETTALRQAVKSPSYRVQMQATLDDGFAPLWLNANRYGRTDVKGTGGHIAFGLFHSAESDSLRKWRIGYGLELLLTANYGVRFYVQQAFADFDYKRIRLSVGSKERLPQMKNPELSSGSQTFGINARPIPEMRFELPEYLPLARWAAIKGHFGYGILTDGRWQRDYVDTSAGYHYSRRAFYHSKAGYLRLGNSDRFPLVFEGGLEMACIFGGIIHRADLGNGGETKLKTGIKDFIKAIYSGGSDITDGDYPNSQGNTVGSWLLSLKYEGNGWAMRAYYDHYFEDHSQMFWQYGWLDGLIGLEFTLPKNPAATTFVYEHLRTTYQSGPIYHDQTEDISTQISAADNYYNHSLCAGWQHWGQAIGNALYTSPIYYANGSLAFTGNRFVAHHFGLCGDPLPTLHYRLLYSYMSNYGNYNRPYPEPRYLNSFLAEVRYSPTRFRGWSATAAFGLDRGRQIGNNTGGQLTLTKTF